MYVDEDEGSHDQADGTEGSLKEGKNIADAREKPSDPKVVADDMSAGTKKKVFEFNVEGIIFVFYVFRNAVVFFELTVC